jgi:hypothetical protein
MPPGGLPGSRRGRGATVHLAAELTGAALSEIAARDPAQHCTHLFDLAVILAAHVDDREATTYDMRVADRVNERTTASLAENGIEKVRWQLDGTAIHDADRDLRTLSRWKHELSPDDAERALMLRRAVFVSGVRHYTAPANLTAAEPGSARMGVCYNYQLPQAATSTGEREPLAGLDLAREFAG